MSQQTSSITIMASVAGVAIQATKSVAHDGGIGQSLALVAAMQTTIVTSASNKVFTVDGVITTAVAGLVDTGKFDVVWSGGKRVNVTLTSHTSTTMTAATASGTGDAWPADATVCQVCPCMKIDGAIPYTDILAAAAYCDQACVLEFCEANGTVIYQLVLTAGSFWLWQSTDGTDNPIDADLGYTKASSSSVIAANLSIGIAADTTHAL
jgi:hypothetical protein